MPGTKTGGRKAANKNLEKTWMKIDGVLTPIEKGSFYQHIGAAGGAESRGGGFAADRKLASEAGRKGGLVSRRKRSE